MTHPSLTNLSRALEQALDVLAEAVVIEGLPGPARAQACGALISVARVAGLSEALAEGIAVLAPDGEQAP